MTLFTVLAATLLALALAWLLPPLLRRGPSSAATRTGANLAVLREQRAQLDAELAAGSLNAEQHRAALAEVERRVIEEEAAAEAPAAAGRAGPTAWVLALGVPLLAAGLYTQIGEPDALAPPPAAAVASDPAASAAEVERLVEALAQRMEAQPGDPNGWRLLARTYAAMGRYEDASRTYARLMTMLPPDAQLMADYADVLAVAQGNRTEGEPMRLVEQALKLDPDNVKALAIAGGDAFERGDRAAALAYWQRAKALAPPDSPIGEAMARSIAEVMAISPAAAAPASAPPAASEPSTASAAAATLSGRVSVAPALAVRVAPTDTVFVFARAAEGPRMPLAIRRFPASALPLEFTLDDATAMAPELKLSRFDRVVVGARISKSGDALPQPGDLLTQTEPLAPGRSGLDLVIDRVQP
jgi:cytochrome c-type biogenesis protein CcmH